MITSGFKHQSKGQSGEPGWMTGEVSCSNKVLEAQLHKQRTGIGAGIGVICDHRLVCFFLAALLLQSAQIWSEL